MVTTGHFFCSAAGTPVWAEAMADPGDNQTSPEEIRSAATLLPEVYADLRRLAQALTGKLQPGQRLQPTALGHEASLRLVRNQDPGWAGRRHFFGAVDDG
jgi:hypothetical protein